MTTYKTTEFETTEALREAINSDLSQLAYPYTVSHRVYGEGQLTFVKAPLIGPSLYATIDFAAGTKTLALDVLFSSNLIFMPEALTETLLEAQTVFKADFEARQQAESTARRLALIQEREAKKKAEEDKKAEAKYEATKAKAIKDFEILSQTERPLSSADEFYYSLGWLAKHVGTVSAALPDYLAGSFSKHFGTDAEARLVDSKKKTAGGNSMQWTFGFKANLTKPENIPAMLQQYLSSTGKAIANTSFIWELVENYGFRFGKKQDLDKIRTCVPASHLSFFEAGLTA